MTSEFFHIDSVTIWHGIEEKHLAMIPFAIGIGILMNYYLIQKPKEERESQVATL